MQVEAIFAELKFAFYILHAIISKNQNAWNLFLWIWVLNPGFLCCIWDFGIVGNRVTFFIGSHEQSSHCKYSD